MKLRIFQKGFNYSQDGPGNRLVYHLQGCNMHCPWCSNPEGIAAQGALIVNRNKLYDGVCPYGAVADGELNRQICVACRERECLKKHSEGIRLSCEEYTLESLLQEALEGRPLMINGGGVTFTGGEATCQFAPIKAILMRLKEHGVNTAIETNGTHPNMVELTPYLDIIMIDFKHWNDERLFAVTGASGAVIKQNIGRMLSEGRSLQIRIPLINGFNASDEDLIGFIEYFRSLDMESSSVEFLPYHEYGREKWAACAMDYNMTGGNVSKDMLRRFYDVFSENEIRIVRT